MKYLTSSRLIGVHSPRSDYDYIEIVENGGGYYKYLVNIAMSPNSHCFYINRKYAEETAKFMIRDPKDYHFIYNAEDFRSGALSISPFEREELWRVNLKRIDFKDKFLYDHVRNLYSKRFYHVVYNLECIKEHTLIVSDEAIERIKRFHDLIATEEEYQEVLNEIQNL